MVKKLPDPETVEDVESVEDEDTEVTQINEDLEELRELRDKYLTATDQYDNTVQSLVEALSIVDLENQYRLEEVVNEFLPTLHALHAFRTETEKAIVEAVASLEDSD